MAHTWRTRADPFEEVWPEVEELLERDKGLQAKTVFEELGRRYPGRFQAGQLRTLQRRFRDWRALRGEDREVYFAQAHHPGEQSQSDFTDMRSLGVRRTAPGPSARHHHQAGGPEGPCRDVLVPARWACGCRGKSGCRCPGESDLCPYSRLNCNGWGLATALACAIQCAIAPLPPPQGAGSDVGRDSVAFRSGLRSCWCCLVVLGGLFALRALRCQPGCRAVRIGWGPEGGLEV